jgi:hypothetical protein
MQLAEEFERPSRGWVQVGDCYELHDFRVDPTEPSGKNLKPLRKDVEQLREILKAQVNHLVEWTDDNRGLTIYWFSQMSNSYSLGEKFELYPNEYLLLDHSQILHLYDTNTGSYLGTPPP